MLFAALYFIIGLVLGILADEQDLFVGYLFFWPVVLPLMLLSHIRQW